MNFFIATSYRCGSMWLARTLGKGDHIVKHESAAGKQGNQAIYRPFPYERWDGKTRYGECHGHLRRHLPDVGYIHGIPRRAILLRDVEAIAQSHHRLHRGESGEAFGLDACRQMAQEVQDHLLMYYRNDPACRLLRFEHLTTSLADLQDLAAWLEISYVPTAEDQAAVVNAKVGGLHAD